jgi:uncharacterized membrane protein YqiK
MDSKQKNDPQKAAQPIEQAALSPRKSEQQLAEFNTSVSALRTQADRTRNVFGFGRRIIVPPDEIHVVVGDGMHIAAMSNDRKVFGQSAERPSRYWLNALTQVIKLKTISFTVPIRGINDEGVEALDNSKVSFRLWAHAVAKLNPEKADTAAQRVGLDTGGLINTITEVGTAELIAAAATMGLQDIIANRQKLAEIAFPKVNQILSELGYDLALLTITQLEGMAYHKLVEQAESRISKETSIATNKEQVQELQDDQGRERTEAEIRAATEKKLAAERLNAEQEVETATLSQQEALAIRRHELEVKQLELAKSAATAAHETELAKVQLGQTLGQAEAEKEATLARIKKERDAELRAIEQQKNASIKLAETKAEAERMAMEQIRQIERAAERTQAEAERLRAEELAAAERAKEIALVDANKLGESMKVEAEAEARALQMRTEAQTKAELVKAEAEATATEKRAKAAKIRAEATRAESAAQGLAEAEVDAARVQVAEQQVAVNRSEGLAQAEVARAQAEVEAERVQRLKEVEINAQQKLVDLYEKAPVLVELEKMKLEHAHRERLATLQVEAYKEAFMAMAPGVKVHIYGNGGQTGKIITDLMSFSQSINLLGEEVPLIGRILNTNGTNGSSEATGDEAENSTINWMRENLHGLSPYIQQVMADVNPRVFSSLKVSDMVDRLTPVLAGKEDLTSSLDQLRQDANFRVVGDLPIVPILKLFGIDLGDGKKKGKAVVDVDEPQAVVAAVALGETAEALEDRKA